MKRIFLLSAVLAALFLPALGFAQESAKAFSKLVVEAKFYVNQEKCYSVGRDIHSPLSIKALATVKDDSLVSFRKSDVAPKDEALFLKDVEVMKVFAGYLTAGRKYADLDSLYKDILEHVRAKMENVPCIEADTQ
jgi:hypothetical protein